VPVTNVSLLTYRALREALSLSPDVVAVSVVIEGDDEAHDIEQRWAAWNPGVPLRVISTEYASVVDPVVALIDEECETQDAQIVVLIPVVVPVRLRHRLLHNHVDFVLSAALRHRTDVMVARVPIDIDDPDLTARPPTG